VTSRALFATQFYDGRIDVPDLVEELADACRSLAQEDAAGRAWSRAHNYRGYTSYASLNDLPIRDPRFADLVRHLNRHVAAFAADCAMDLGGRRLKLDSLWVNVLKPGGSHSGHIHPHSVVSGTVYIAVPPGAGALKLEDPRLPLMMAAPPRRRGRGAQDLRLCRAAAGQRLPLGKLAAPRSRPRHRQGRADQHQLQLSHLTSAHCAPAKAGALATRAHASAEPSAPNAPACAGARWEHRKVTGGVRAANGLPRFGRTCGAAPSREILWAFVAVSLACRMSASRPCSMP
jgi:uncharacterized protein (TIGR02466 family)